ncbi:MAG: hypothetical protein CMJ47_03445 [Planctomyces sp.]|nr:hypothetical protein [Planctomyces sp.]
MPGGEGHALNAVWVAEHALLQQLAACPQTGRLEKALWHIARKRSTYKKQCTYARKPHTSDGDVLERSKTQAHNSTPVVGAKLTEARL